MTLDKREILALSGISLVGFLIRVIFVFFMGADPLVYDSKMYLLVADGIVNEAPISSFPNGYPLVIAIFRSFLPTAQTIQALLGLNVLLSVSCIPLTYHFCKLCRMERWIPLAASCMIAVYPHQLRYSQLVMTETIATTVLLSAMVGTLWIWNKRSVVHSSLVPFCLITGFLFHVTGAIRPSLLLVGVLIPLIVALLSRTVKIPLYIASGFLIGAGLLFVIEKSPIARPPHAFGNNLLISIYSDSNGTEFVAFPEDQQKKAVKTYIEFAVKNPSRFVRQRAISLWELWGPKSLAGYRQEQESGVVKVIVMLRTVFLLLFLAGSFAFRAKPEVVLATIPVGVVTMVHTMTFSNHRFLVPIEPFLFMVSLLAIGALARHLITKTSVGSSMMAKSVDAQ
ncbi:MAG: hypothetical protein ACKO14_13400 [Armatimonadota bacterium]